MKGSETIKIDGTLKVTAKLDNMTGVTGDGVIDLVNEDKTQNATNLGNAMKSTVATVKVSRDAKISEDITVNNKMVVADEATITVDNAKTLTIKKDITGGKIVLNGTGKVKLEEGASIPESWKEVIVEKLTNDIDTSNDTTLSVCATSLSEAAKSNGNVNCLGSITYATDTNTVKFDITDKNKARTQKLMDFLSVGGGNNIVQMFKTFATGAKKAQWIAGEDVDFENFTEQKDSLDVINSVEFTDDYESKITEIAAALLFQMSKTNHTDGGWKADGNTFINMKFEDVEGTQATARFYYTDPNTNLEYYVDYTLVFTKPEA